LGGEEAEALANKAGLSLQRGKDFAECLRALTGPARANRKFYDSALVSERMFQYFRRGAVPPKETLLAISIALGLGVDGTRQLLKKAGYALSASLPGDAATLWLMSHPSGKGGDMLSRVNDVLYELGLPLLMTREKSQN
jgi:hypothetical protein